MPLGGAPEVMTGVLEAVTLMWLEVPLMEDVTVSVAVMVWLPAVSKVSWNVPALDCRVASAGRIATPSELEMCTVPL